jgi:hypothetical protein
MEAAKRLRISERMHHIHERKISDNNEIFDQCKNFLGATT